MPSSEDIPIRPIDALVRALDEALRIAIKTEGVNVTLKSLKKGRLPASGMITVYEGDLQEQPSGLYDAALETERGRVVLRNAQRTDRITDSQLIPSANRPGDKATVETLTPEELLNQLASLGADAPARMICEIELTRFEAAERQKLLPLLWEYILWHRDGNSPDTLAAVGAAIRKYVALMPLEEMGQLAVLLESGHKSSLPIELEIEVAKMIYRNFEVHPPLGPNPQPELGKSLWEMVQAYANPRLLLRDKHSAAASIGIQALVAIRSGFAAEALRVAATSRYRWFSEVVADNLDRLHERWSTRSPDAAAWLTALQKDVQVTA